MLILNHELLEKLEIKKIDSIKDVENSLPKAFLIVQDLQLAKFCFENSIAYCALVEGIKDSLFFVNLGAKYLLTKDLEFAKVLQNLAENYLFDSKILLAIKEESEIEKVAKSGIDGVIFWRE